MKCPKCGTNNESGSTFCAHCGGSLSKGSEATPAQQATQMSQKFQSIIKDLLLGEKILAVGIILNLISFFLPWASFHKLLAQSWNISPNMTGLKIGGWAYLMPLAMLVCLGMLYFSLGAKPKSKVQRSTWQALIGAVFFTVGVVLCILFSKAQAIFPNTVAAAGGQSEKVLSVGFGLWVLMLGSLAMLVGAMWAQKENLKNV
jgi:hypothetical protein